MTSPPPRMPAVGVAVIAYLAIYLAAAVPTVLVPLAAEPAQAALKGGLASLRIFAGVPIFSGNGDADEKQTTLCALVFGAGAAGTELLYACPEAGYAPTRRHYDSVVQKLLTQSAAQLRSDSGASREDGSLANAVLAQHFCGAAAGPHTVYVAMTRGWVSWDTGARRAESSVEYGWSCAERAPVVTPSIDQLIQAARG